MMTMAFVSDNYLHKYFHKNAKSKLHEAFYDLSLQLKVIEKDLLESLYFISKNESIVASLNLINNYEDINDYNHIIFDEEKKRIIEILSLEGKYSLNDHIAVYDNHYRLVAFMDRDDAEYYVGFVSYDNAKAIYHTRRINETSYTISREIKHIELEFDISERIGEYELQSGGVIYEELDDRLNLQSHRAILRNISETKNDILGYIEINKGLYKKDINKLIERDDLKFNYYFNNKERLQTTYIDNKIDFIKFTNSPLLFSKYTPDELILDSSTMELFYSAVFTPLKKGSLLITAQINKNELYNALLQSRQILIVTVVFIILLTVLVSLIILNRMVSLPLKYLLEGIKVISKGDYSHKIEIKNMDELGLISQKFNEMADKIAKRETELDELAHYDVLTKIPNRAMFMERLEEAISRANRNNKKLAVFFLDLDQFKNINDTLGHDIGDKIISENCSKYFKCNAQR